MALTEERIKEIMVKDLKTKTVLVDKDQEESIISTHEKEGWKLVRKTELNNKLKITFQMAK